MSQRSASPHSDKNFSNARKKRISKNRIQQSEKISQVGQSKITHFFKNVQKIQKKAPNQIQKVQMQLQTELQKLKQHEQTIIGLKQQIVEQQNNIKKQFDTWIKKSRAIVQDCICEIYANRRLRKLEVNTQVGFYDQNCRVFTQGTFGMDCQSRMKKLGEILNNNDFMGEEQQEMIEQFYDQEEQRYRLYKKQLLKYKEKLKNGYEQKSCKFATSWPLLANKYQVLQLIGKGGFSQVYKGYDLEQNKFVAIKMSSTSGIKSQLTHYIVRQYQNHLKLQHPNIAKMYQVVQVTNNSVCIALEFCDGPQLSVYIKQNVRIPEKKSKFIMKQILLALNYLSNLNPKIIHFDLKPQNIMFCDGKVKILDFGLSRQIDNEHSKIALSNQGVGTYWYLPPETFIEKNPQISQKVDIWSAGVILYEMLYGRKPFGHNKSQSSIIKEGIILDANQVQFPDDIQVSDNAKNLIIKCLAYNYQERLTPKQALSHPFFQ